MSEQKALRPAQVHSLQRALDTLRALERELDACRFGASPLYLIVQEFVPDQAQDSLTFPGAPTPVRDMVIASGSRRQAQAPRHMAFSYYRDATMQDRALEAQSRAAMQGGLADGEWLALQAGPTTFPHPLIDVLSRMGGHLASNGWKLTPPYEGRDPGLWAEVLHDRILPDRVWAVDAGDWKRVEVSANLPLPHVVEYRDVAAASVQLVENLAQDLERRLAFAPFATLEFISERDVVLNGERFKLSDGHGAVLRSLARARQLGRDNLGRVPIGGESAKSFRTRLSDMRSPNGRVQRAFRLALNALPLPLFHPSEPRFNPELDVRVIFP